MQIQNTQSTSVKSSALLLLLVVGALLGVGTTTAKLSPMLGWSPLAVLQWAMLGGGMFQLLSLKLRGVELRFSKRIFVYSIGTGILIALPNAAGFAAVEHVGASFVAISFALALVFTYAMALVLRLEVFKQTRFWGVIFGLVGAITFSLVKVDPAGNLNIWVIVALTGPVFVSVGNIYRTVFMPKDVHPGILAAGMTLLGGVTMFVLNFALRVPMTPTSMSTAGIFLLLGQMAVFAILYDLYFLLQKTAGPVYLSQIGSVCAVFGVALAILIFHEIPTYWDLLATAFVAAGVVLVNRRD